MLNQVGIYRDEIVIAAHLNPVPGIEKKTHILPLEVAPKVYSIEGRYIFL